MRLQGSLLEIGLAEFDGEVEPDALRHAPLEVQVEVTHLDFEPMHPRLAVVSAGIELVLVAADGEEAMCSISATYRLTYGVRYHGDDGEQRSFASTRGLSDAWPSWRAWVIGVLASMGLGPPPLPPRLPPFLVADGEAAFDATRQVKAESERAQ